jgi:hypothetical protein
MTRLFIKNIFNIKKFNYEWNGLLFKIEDVHVFSEKYIFNMSNGIKAFDIILYRKKFYVNKDITLYTMDIDKMKFVISYESIRNPPNFINFVVDLIKRHIERI